MAVNLLANKKPTLSSGLALFELLCFQTNATLRDLGKVPKSVTKRIGEGPRHRKSSITLPYPSRQAVLHREQMLQNPRSGVARGIAVPERTGSVQVAAGKEHAFLTADWRYLAMLNYEVEPALLAPHVPA